jgi:hypothetical protein
LNPENRIPRTEGFIEYGMFTSKPHGSLHEWDLAPAADAAERAR